jgi:hypothetical protein
MARQNVRRLVYITGMGTGDSHGHGGFLHDRLFLPLLLRSQVLITWSVSSSMVVSALAASNTLAPWLMTTKRSHTMKA